MKITTRQTCIRTLRKGDSKFTITDGLVQAPRAGFEIDQRCPSEYRIIIQQAIEYGWLKPIANVKDNELFWEEFSR
jgi:hypothetical protein